jgi:hypothetical protein
MHLSITSDIIIALHAPVAEIEMLAVYIPRLKGRPAGQLNVVGRLSSSRIEMKLSNCCS